MFANFSTQLKLPTVDGDNTIFEYFVDESGNWKHWDEKVISQFCILKEKVMHINAINIYKQ